jgi:predicted lipoprotein with Yx(FWY)xxD motif
MSQRVRWQTAAGIAAVGLFAAACSSSGGGTSGGGTTTKAATSSVVIEAHSAPSGTFLTDGAGKALYMFDSDSSTKSSCDDQCLHYWPLVFGKPTAGSGVTQSKLGTITTAGAAQITYAGHPLYYYVGDSKPGQTSGQGLDDFGAQWWLLAPSGSPVTSGGSSDSSGGYGYGG